MKMNWEQEIRRAISSIEDAQDDRSLSDEKYNELDKILENLHDMLGDDPSMGEA